LAESIGALTCICDLAVDAHAIAIKKGLLSTSQTAYLAKQTASDL
jgi:hypothetical protein